MGNGKTLLGAAIAIIFAKLRKIPVFIIGKNGHLTLRDSKKFESLIKSVDLEINTNHYSDQPGVYYYTQKDLDTASKNPDFMKIWVKSLAVLDESDWLMFDGTAELMERRLRLYSKAATVVGLTGSALTSKEL
jgi:hypothetical protein